VAESFVARLECDRPLCVPAPWLCLNAGCGLDESRDLPGRLRYSDRPTKGSSLKLFKTASPFGRLMQQAIALVMIKCEVSSTCGREARIDARSLGAAG
jgi:hypothetical protein